MVFKKYFLFLFSGIHCCSNLRKLLNGSSTPLHKQSNLQGPQGLKSIFSFF